MRVFVKLKSIVYIYYICAKFFELSHTVYMAELRRTFIQNLKYYRKLKGLRQLDLALEIGKSTNYINSIENGKYFPSPETIEKIAEILEIEPIRLFIQENPDSNEKIKEEKTDLKAMENLLRELISKDITKVFTEL